MRKSLVILMLVSLLTLAVPRAEASGDFASDAGIGIAFKYSRAQELMRFCGMMLPGNAVRLPLASVVSGS